MLGALNVALGVLGGSGAVATVLGAWLLTPWGKRWQESRTVDARRRVDAAEEDAKVRLLILGKPAVVLAGTEIEARVPGVAERLEKLTRAPLMNGKGDWLLEATKHNTQAIQRIEAWTAEHTQHHKEPR